MKYTSKCDLCLMCTGKTVTLVEAIRQVEKTDASCHILACAHSNSAADLLCEKLMNPEVYRLYAKCQEGEITPNPQVGLLFIQSSHLVKY